MKRRDINIALAILLAFGGIIYSYVKLNELEARIANAPPKQGQNNRGFKIGDSLPLTTPGFDLSGSKVSSKDLLRRGRTLAFFFSVSCPICLEDAHLWGKLYHHFQTKPIKFLGLCVSPTLDAAATRRFMEYNEIKFPVILIPLAEMHKIHNPFFVPQIVVLNERGIVENAWTGSLNATDDFVKIESYLKTYVH